MDTPAATNTKADLEISPVIPPPAAPVIKLLDGREAQGKNWDSAIKGIIYVLTFVLPILVTPWTFEPFEFSKQVVLFVLVAGALAAWLLKMLVLRRLRFVKTPLDLPILIFLLVYLAASILSIDRIASFFGFYGSFSGNFFQILALVIFYYAVVNNFRNPGEIKRLFLVFFVSASLAVLYALVQFFGVYILPFPAAKAGNFNTIGGLLLISIFSALVVNLSLGVHTKTIFSKVAKTAVIAAGLIILFTVNFFYAWAALLIGLLAHLIFKLSFSEGRIELREFAIPLVLIILVVSFFIVQSVFPFVNLQSIFGFDLPREVRLDYVTAKSALLGTVASKPVLGTGPNTFFYNFSQYRDQNFNLSSLWNVRFDRAPSEAAAQLVGTGILGLMVFEALNLIFLIYAFFFLTRKSENKNWNLAVTIFASFIILWFAHWFFFFNTILAFSFWLLIAGFMAIANSGVPENVRVFDFSFVSSPRRTISIVSAVSVFLILTVISVFFSAAIYASDIFFRNGINLSQTPDTYDEAQSAFQQAIQLNKFRPDYYLAYGEFLFVRINRELTEETPDIPLIQQWLATSINTSREAVKLSPQNWANWERLANLYIIARPLVAGVDKFIIESLQKATEADSKNPILFTKLGQVYRLAARRLDPAILGSGADSDSDGLSDSQEQALGSDPQDPDSNGNNVPDGDDVLAGLNPAGSGALDSSFLDRYLKVSQDDLLKAEKAFRTAIELKPDYGTAYYQLALTLEQGGQLDSAMAEMEKVLQRFPSDLGLKFELGRMYFNANRTEDAIRQFMDIVLANPGNANAHFSLALSYERLGRAAKALDEYRKVEEISPGSAGIAEKIRQLEDQLSTVK
ncbi:MAG: tetratricopeptide repeat protein [Candidatus Doudnabacteria bacterium]|nr:tetratricopeptide repeat protein [bacterium]MDZ4243550.1 tetratricopeptide repeat protein [Candidatus Doudnabacteria bacterium]